MKNFMKNQNGFTFVQLMTTIAIIILIAALLFPIIVRVMNNIKEQAIFATLYSLLEAQRSYRDAQTPTTYANSIAALVNAGYIIDVRNRYGYTFAVFSRTPDTFEIRGLRSDGSGYAINQNGTISVFTPPPPAPPPPPPPAPPRFPRGPGPSGGG